MSNYAFSDDSFYHSVCCCILNIDPIMCHINTKWLILYIYILSVYSPFSDRNVVQDGRPPPINSSEKDLTRKECSTLLN